jgi:sugar/nucleoside kinase (ribokinase family)
MRALLVGGVSWNRIIHVDHLPEPQPHTIRADRTYDTLGGTGAGKAWNLAALGWDVELVAAVGDDDAGDRVRAALSSLGIRFTAVADPAGTEQHTNLMAADGGRLSIYTNASSAVVPLDVDAVVASARRDDLVCVNILDHCRPVLGPLRAAGVEIWTDLHDFDGREAHHRPFVAAAQLVQVSSDRLPTWRSWGDERLGAGARTVVVTHGSAGADGNTGSGWVHTPARLVESVDTNGAGDAFFAGFATAHLAGADTALALERGAEAAARCVVFEGLGPPI